MSLNPDECYRAICARDVRYDGRFFICVHTTGIFCRPVCPARTPKRENVQFVESAAAALAMGFRACKRCRPEVKAGAAAWGLTDASLRRALRLINTGALDHQTVEEFAARLGFGARHLRRLIRASLGVAPNRLALIRRATLARSLIEGGDLTMTQIAAASGFSSLRRFNDVIQAEFGASPTTLRAAAGRTPRGSTGETSLILGSRGQANWAELYAFLRARTIPGVESASDDVYARVLTLGDRQCGVALSADGDQAVRASISGAAIAQFYELTALIRRALDLDTDTAAIAKVLRSDAVLRPAILPGAELRLPGSWTPFELSVRAILGQQVSVKAARTLAGRIAAQFGERVRMQGMPAGLSVAFPTAARIAAAEASDFMALGLTRARATTLVRFARAIVNDPGLLMPSASLEQAIGRLVALDGIGPWTAHYIALRALGETDAFPASDLGLRKAYAALTGHLPSAAELETRSQAWRPWRGYAAQYLWTYLAHLELGAKTSDVAA
ncbi:MAG TPA: 3-methyladenine DNA glycosylase 2 [Alphaproteobacteria bacterium]|nr:3-methyladenine DNA glycosylase 2 [Alphaproteobacteria bacterium]